MNFQTQAKQILDDHYAGKLNTHEFLHALNRMVTVRKDEPTVTERLDDGSMLIQTTDAKLIPRLLNSDAVIMAKSTDENGFTNKLRAVVGAGVLV